MLRETSRWITIAVFLVAVASQFYFVPAVFGRTLLNELTFQNRSGENARVKVIGPSQQIIDVPNNSAKTVKVKPGEYYIVVRYGSGIQRYRYSRGVPFTVRLTATGYSTVSITLHRVIGGNYRSNSISQEEFESAEAGQASSGNEKQEAISNAVKLYNSGNYEGLFQIVQRYAKQGNSISLFILGRMFQFGRGISKDLNQAIKWYEEAAKRGQLDAMYQLGLLYSDEQGTHHSYAKAVRWYRLAAENGHEKAQINLGVSYLAGRGVAPNYVQAYKWWKIAAAQGSESGQKNLEAIKNKLTASQIQEVLAELSSRSKRPSSAGKKYKDIIENYSTGRH